MMTFFREGGVMMYPLLLVTIVMIVLSVRAWLRLRVGDPGRATAGTGIDAIVFWGAYAVVLGVLGTLVGVSIAAGAISRASEVSPAVIWSGIRVALSTTIYGLLVFAVSLLVWFALRVAHRRRLAAGAA
jgi:hypothetical protein